MLKFNIFRIQKRELLKKNRKTTCLFGLFLYICTLKTTGIPHSAELHKSLKTNSLPLQSNSRQRAARGYTDSFEVSNLPSGIYYCSRIKQINIGNTIKKICYEKD